MQSTSPRRTDVLLGLKCSICGEPLTLMPGLRLLELACKAGHTVSMDRLLELRAKEVERRMRAVLATWQEKAILLEQAAEVAHIEDREELRQTFLREAESLRERIMAVRAHLGTGEERPGGAAAG